MTNRNPRTFDWEYDEPRESKEPVGPDGFLPVGDQDPPQILMEVTLRFEGTELKGYTGAFEVEQQFALPEIFLDNCITPIVADPNVAQKIILQASDLGFVSTPAHSDFNFGSSLELIMRYAPNDWTTIRTPYCSKFDGGLETGYRWQMGVISPAKPQFFWYSDNVFFSSEVDNWIPIVANGEDQYLRLTFDASGGQTVIKHWDSHSGQTWRLIHQDTLGTEEPIDATAGVEMRVGGDSNAVSGFIDGDLFFFQFYDAEGGTLKAEVQASSFTIGDGVGDSAADLSGKVWTLVGTNIAVA